jgi:hypothetical protein
VIITPRAGQPVPDAEQRLRYQREPRAASPGHGNNEKHKPTANKNWKLRFLVDYTAGAAHVPSRTRKLSATDTCNHLRFRDKVYGITALRPDTRKT